MAEDICNTSSMFSGLAEATMLTKIMLPIELEDGEVIAVEIDEAARQEAYERIQAKMARLRRGDHIVGDDQE